jgi:hypothetical protein
MHKQSLVAFSWCLVIGAAVVLILEVHRSHETPRIAQPIVQVERAEQPIRLVGTTSPTPSPLPAPATVLPRESESLPRIEPATLYVANVQSRKFHRLSCHYADCRNCTLRFDSRDAALAAGMRPGGCCHP